MVLKGTISQDWLIAHGARGNVGDALLRAWRDFLEQRLADVYGMDAELTLGTRTRFSVSSDSEHSVIEIEAFARRALDGFLNGRKEG